MNMSAMNDVNNIKVKCFDTYCISGMESVINEWLTKNNVYIVDIKLISMCNRCTVLIVYRED